MERIVILPMIGFFTLGIVFFLLVIWGPSLYKKRKSRHAPVVSLPAQVAKVYYDAYGSPLPSASGWTGKNAPANLTPASRKSPSSRSPAPGAR